MAHDPHQDFFSSSPRFALCRCLGEGGFGTVYHVFDKQRQQDVALKMLKRQDAQSIYRFKQEFRSIVDSISHPNLITFYELIHQQDQLLLTMELIEGVDFLEFVQHAPTLHKHPTNIQHAPTQATPPHRPLQATLPVAEIPPHSQPPPHPNLSDNPPYDETRLRHALLQLVQGVHALHQAGKLHRDLKPSNVLVTQDQRVVLLDFGLVADVHPDNIYNSFLAAGTPAYMAPEQAKNIPPTEALDWYSVGAILYEALTQRLPFESQNALQILHQKQTQPPLPPQSIVPRIPDDLNLLCLELLATEPQQRPSGSTILASLQDNTTIIKTTPPPPTQQKVPLIGRKSQLRALQDAFQITKQGQLQTIFLQANTGLGKSKLIRRFLKHIQRNHPQTILLATQCHKQESVPYKAIDGLMDRLARVLRDLPPAQAQNLLPIGITELTRLFPVLLQVPSIQTQAHNPSHLSDPQETRRRAFLAFRELMQRLSHHAPLLLCIDDLQWGDTDSASLLNELFRPPNPPPLFFLASFRSDDKQQSPFFQTLHILQQPKPPPHLLSLSLQPLNPQETEKLARALLKHTSAQEQTIHEASLESRGNPFFLEEIVRYISQTHETPRDFSLEHVLHTRFDELSTHARKLLELIAASGSPTPLGAIQTIFQKDHPSTPFYPILSHLQTRHLVRSRGPTDHEELDTYHSQIRDAILANTEPTRLQHLHQYIAHTLAQQPNPDPERLAHHYQQSGQPQRALQYILTAATQASDALAFARAARLYKRALSLSSSHTPQQTHLLKQYAQALAHDGQGPLAAQTYQQAAEHTDELETRQLLHLAAHQLLRSGHIDQGLQLLSQVLQSLGMKLAESPFQAITSMLWRRILLSLRPLTSPPPSHNPLPPKDQLRVDVAHTVAKIIGMVDPIRGADFQARHLLLTLRSGDPTRIALAYAVEAAYRSFLGRRGSRQTQRLLLHTMSLAKTVHHPLAIATATLTSGMVAYTQGRWRKAFQLCSQAETTLRRQCTGAFWELANAQIFACNAQLYLGEFADIADRLPAILQEAKSHGDLYTKTFLSAGVLSKVHLAHDNVQDALHTTQQALSQWTDQGFSLQHYIELVVKGEIALYQNQSPQAWQLLQQKYKTLRRSYILYNQFNLLEFHHLRARIAIHYANTLPTPSHEYLRAQLLQHASQSIRTLQKEKTPWADPIALSLRACLAITHQQPDEALFLLTSAEVGFDDNHMALLANATRLRRVTLLQNPQQRQSLQQQATQWFNTQRIKNIPQWLSLLLPGPWPTQNT